MALKLKSLIRNLLYISPLGGKRIMLPVGSNAPDFTVRTHEGEEIQLSEQRGRTVVLWFYPKADTPG